MVSAADEFERVRLLDPMKTDRRTDEGRVQKGLALSEGALRVVRNAGPQPSLWDLGLFIFENAFEGLAGALQEARTQMVDGEHNGQLEEHNGQLDSEANSKS